MAITNESKSSNSSDEINLSQLFKSIGNGFKNFGNSTLKGIASLRRSFLNHYIFFSISIVSAIIFAVVYYFSLRVERYTSSMILSCDYLNKRIIENSIEKLNLLCKEKEREGLSELLSIDISTAQNIYKFSAKSFISEDDRLEIERLKEQLNNVVADKKDLASKVIGKLELGNQKSFLIEVNVFDPNIVKKLDTAIVNFFRTNEYVQKRITSNKVLLQNKRIKLIRESKKLDSLKNVLYSNFESMSKQSRQGSNNVILSDKYLTDPISVFKEDLILNDEIRLIDNQLFVRPDFEVVDGLTTFREPSNVSLPVLLIIAIFGSIVLGYILLGLWNFNKYLSKLA